MLPLHWSGVPGFYGLRDLWARLFADSRLSRFSCRYSGALTPAHSWAFLPSCVCVRSDPRHTSVPIPDAGNPVLREHLHLVVVVTPTQEFTILHAAFLLVPASFQPCWWWIVPAEASPHHRHPLVASVSVVVESISHYVMGVSPLLSSRVPRSRSPVLRPSPSAGGRRASPPAAPRTAGGGSPSRLPSLPCQ